MSIDVWCKQNNLRNGSIFASNWSHREKEKEEGDNDPSSKILKQVMTSWQKCCLISKEYFSDKVAVLGVIDYYNVSIVFYFHDFNKKLQIKQLSMDQFVMKGQKRKAYGASESDSKREKDSDGDEHDDGQQQPTPQ